jgi:hypothetical protein
LGNGSATAPSLFGRCSAARRPITGGWYLPLTAVDARFGSAAQISFHPDSCAALPCLRVSGRARSAPGLPIASRPWLPGAAAHSQDRHALPLPTTRRLGQFPVVPTNSDSNSDSKRLRCRVGSPLAVSAPAVAPLGVMKSLRAAFSPVGVPLGARLDRGLRRVRVGWNARDVHSKTARPPILALLLAWHFLPFVRVLISLLCGSLPSSTRSTFAASFRLKASIPYPNALPSWRPILSTKR